MREFIWKQRYALHLWWLSDLSYAECRESHAPFAFALYGADEGPIEAAEIDFAEACESPGGCDCCAPDDVEGGK